MSEQCSKGCESFYLCDACQLVTNLYATICFKYLFDLVVYVPITQQISVMSGRVFVGCTSTKQGKMCLAQWHNTVTSVRLEPAALSQVLYH